MEAVTPLSMDEVLEQERQRLRETNEVIWERTQKEWRAKQWDQKTLLEIAVSIRATLVDLYIDLMEKRMSWVDALARRPERWVAVGVLLVFIGLCVYLMDVLG